MGSVMSKKQVDSSPPTVADAESILQRLEEKQKQLTTRGQDLAEQRKVHAYAAHAVQDAAAERELADVIEAIATNDGLLASIAEAVNEAKNRVLIAKAYEADVADQAKAQQILELIGAFREAGAEMDAACRTLSETGKLLGSLLLQLHGLGVQFPSRQQLDVLGNQALLTAVLATPWGSQYQRLAPGQRQSFRTLCSDWAQMIESRIGVRLGAQNDEEAA
jgi:hypothetical protein